MLTGTTPRRAAVAVGTVADARLPGRPGRWDLTLAGGRITAVTPTGTATTGPDTLRLDVDGRVVTGGFVDAHVHLDKAFLPVDGCGPRLADAIATVDRHRRHQGLVDVVDEARRAAGVLARHGTTAARVHAEIGPDIGLDLLEAQLALADELRDQLHLQLVAFPQLGLEQPGAPELLAGALALGAPVVGGCPYVDADPAAHLDLVFGLADRHQAPVDLHLDFSDEPGRSQLPLVVERTRALGLAGRVVVGHVTTLAAMAPDDQARALAALAEAGIGLVVAPATDLYLAGHGEPGTRSLAPIERALAAGVRVAIATNNLANPFAPYGNGSLLHAAWLAGLTRRVQPTASLLATISTGPAALLGLDAPTAAPGAPADLVVLDTTDADAVVERCPAVLATVRVGRLTHPADHRPAPDHNTAEATGAVK